MRRVAVTGVGVITPIGTGPGPFWTNLLEGVSGAGPVTSFSTEGLRNRVGCEIRNFSPPDRGTEGRTPGRASLLAATAAALALEDAGLSGEAGVLGATGIAVGTTMGEAQELWESRPARPAAVAWAAVPPFACEAIALHVASRFSLRGPMKTFPMACAAGNYACAYAYEAVRSGRADVMLAGGADAFSRVAFLGLSRLRVMAPDACRPFDRNRKGMLLGEGAGMLVLEDMEHAKARGARMYAEVLGYGLSCQAHHMPAPYHEDQGAALAIERALSNSRVEPREVDYISAHGTGTPNNDRRETLAVKRAFGRHAYRLAVSSTKAVLGHAMGAASAIEAAVCALTIAYGLVPPTWNLEAPGPECDLDYVREGPRPASVAVALNNAYGFGGNNACLVLGHPAR